MRIIIPDNDANDRVLHLTVTQTMRIITPYSDANDEDYYT